LLSACSTCDIPNGSYKSYGGSESITALALSSKTYTLLFEQWAPTNYDSRDQKSEQGTWSCTGSTIEINTKNGLAPAEFRSIGENPLGLPITTKALVFEPSTSDVLSTTIMYLSKDLE
jgi:hypothetical protein